ncbi:hypothetical protein AZ23_2774 [Bordetella bronchiseptica E010]|nr:hypothetical protein AZ23_2774 [Bordetella bronchiseptica E010]
MTRVKPDGRHGAACPARRLHAGRTIPLCAESRLLAYSCTRGASASRCASGRSAASGNAPITA